MRRLIIRGGRLLSGKIPVSGAKNAALKLLAASLLTDQKVTLHSVPHIQDVYTMIGVLNSLGVEARFTPDGLVTVHPPTTLGEEAPDALVRSMRASVQVMGPLLARRGSVRISMPGGCSIGSRPIDYHLDGLRAMGVDVEESGGVVYARADRLRAVDYTLPYPSVGATENLMMAACATDGVTVIRNAAREPEVVEVQNFLNALGARVSGAESGTVRVEGGRRLHGADYSVMPDRIEAGSWILAAAITGGTCEVAPIVCEHLSAFLQALRRTGVRCECAGSSVVVQSSGRTFPTDIVTLPYPGFPTDLQPQMMAFLSTANGVSTVSERVYANRFKHVSELRRMGADIAIDGHTAIIRGRGKEVYRGAAVHASDLRAGAALVIAGLAAKGETVIESVEHIERGYENIVGKLRGAGAEIAFHDG